MAVNLDIRASTALLIGGGLAAYIFRDQITEYITDVAAEQAQNLATGALKAPYSLVNEIGEQLTDDPEFNLGVFIFEHRSNPLLWPVVLLFETTEAVIDTGGDVYEFFVPDGSEASGGGNITTLDPIVVTPEDQ